MLFSDKIGSIHWNWDSLAKRIGMALRFEEYKDIMEFVYLDNGIKSNCRRGNRAMTGEWVLCLPLISSGDRITSRVSL